MISNIYHVSGDDSYQAEVDTSTETVRIVWRYRSNRPSRPEPLAFSDLDHDLQTEIDRKIIRFHGFSVTE